MGLQPGPWGLHRLYKQNQATQGLQKKHGSERETDISLGTPLGFASLGQVRSRLAIPLNLSSFSLKQSGPP